MLNQMKLIQDLYSVAFLLAFDLLQNLSLTPFHFHK